MQFSPKDFTPHQKNHLNANYVQPWHNHKIERQSTVTNSFAPTLIMIQPSLGLSNTTFLKNIHHAFMYF
jgi:hypothetical protein